ncbi:unnamed protein product [Mycena citricolor]|uniref:GYF domain-containing protein n=1 Tax=Mycena citricolor TaxID=2018698 RepID=A0AAD2K5E1_9AGAR|nr:unnamed protein product [Mycena citricolor]
MATEVASMPASVTSALDVHETIQEVVSAAPDVLPTGLEKIVSPEDEAPSPSRGPSLSTSATEPLSDATSVQSMPAVLVTDTTVESEARRARRASTLQNDELAPPSPSSPSRSTHESSQLTPSERRNRHRSAIDTRPNRLSGFFTNLIHRRETPSTNVQRGATPRSEQPSPTPSPLAHTPTTPSRPSSPPPTRPSTPPPRLPPPTLRELGLSLSVVTEDLSPSHFSTPPTSGTFLAPHYLLLCHAQGLDVLPLVTPPISQPYALVRRVSFKSVVVMEQRGVLVAIAGRRDGVRVYALEEVKKAIEWRMDVETRRERERQRRDVKKMPFAHMDLDGHRDSTEKNRKTSLSTPPPGEAMSARGKLPRKASQASIPPLPPPPSATPAVPLVPRTPTIKRFKSPRLAPSPTPEPSGHPPPYSHSDAGGSRLVAPIQTRSRSGSVTNVLAAAARTPPHDMDTKAELVESSDDEAINVVAAGASGSQALDERTSARLSANLAGVQPQIAATASQPVPGGAGRRNRPANLDLSLSIPSTGAQIAPSEPSPAPTLLTLRQALSNSPSRRLETDPDTPFFGDLDEEDEDVDGQISLAEALLESRIPDLPPAGSRQAQQPIMLQDDEPGSPITSEHSLPIHGPSSSTERPTRRRWSLLVGSSPPETSNPSGVSMTRARSFRSSQSVVSAVQASASASAPSSRPTTSSTSPAALISTEPTTGPAATSAQPVVPLRTSVSSSRSSRFIPRILTNAFQSRRGDERPPLPALTVPTDPDVRRSGMTPTSSAMPPPKLEYVKLPGTKGALTIKSVETPKKSFLAILCGENGEKVELFAGTYRTALGLSRTFILPDSPRLLELQLQGDDLVEVFLVFGQNVFGLEPATVRVREVRIGRAERRAARRRAREVRAGETEPGGEDDVTTVDVTIVATTGNAANGDSADHPATPTLVAGEHPDAADTNSDPVNGETGNDTTAAAAIGDELTTVANAKMGPYTTFQQLNFAPRFPLASIADDYIIPPTYPDFLEYKSAHEPEAIASGDLAQIQFSPPGLPVPVATAPSRWYYRDPKNNIHGPWKASLMQAWYKDGLLPPDLPVRREEDTDYLLLKDLRLQSVDPSHPFRIISPSAPPASLDSEKPLLSPISLLAQPRHFGPPALFFSTRGGHSTAIVDARGRSVLKGRFVWSDEAGDLASRMGDVKRLEAFDVKDRSVLVAMRQGGLEAVDLGDALLRPADGSRTALPQFHPPYSNINRRGPFVWKMGMPVSALGTNSATVLSSHRKAGSAFSTHLPGKKSSSAVAKSPGRVEFSAGESEVEMTDEVLFLGRKEDEIYICERNAGSFRILRLGPNLLLG